MTEPSTGVEIVDLGELGFDGGAHVVVAHHVRRLPADAEVEVRGTHPDLRPQLRAWCTANGHRWLDGPFAVGASNQSRWSGAEPAGAVDAVAAQAPGHWGLALRGVWVEAGGPSPRFSLDTRDEIWSDDASRLYERALAGQWDPAVAIPWDAFPPTDPDVETAVVQIMTYLVENEEAALVVPARFLGQVHPHFAEVQHLLAVQIADEARHAHVFARRARLGESSPRQSSPRRPALSGAGGRASLQTLLDEPDFATASFLLSVLGEGTFLSLLAFLERFAPDECTRAITRLARADEARHVAFGLSHLERHCLIDPALRDRLAAAIEHRYDALRSTSGLNDAVFDALVVVAAGSLEPSAIANGWHAVQELQRDMNDGRIARLGRLGFAADEARRLATMHTRNFM